ncbi:MAG: DNA helicase UvrD [Candidatus Nitrotoga sp.]
MVTYTENNYKNLHSRITTEYGCIPDRIRLYTYFSFLYSFCLRPFLGDKLRVRGINFDEPPEYTRKLNISDERRYLDKARRLYKNRMAGLLIVKGLMPDVNCRLSKYFDSFFVDEVQDFAGHDFNFMCDLTSTDVLTVLVGDFYQHTFDTSRDGNVNMSLHKDLTAYKSKLKKKDYVIDDTVLGKSHRCSPTVCDFVSQKIGIDIESHRNDETKVEYVESEARADQLFHQPDIVKLFYQSHHKYRCFSDNWGASKGIDSYGSVCVVLNNKTDGLYKSGRLTSLPPVTKNKLYVACTRSRADIHFVPEKYYRKYKI